MCIRLCCPSRNAQGVAMQLPKNGVRIAGFYPDFTDFKRFLGTSLAKMYVLFLRSYIQHTYINKQQKLTYIAFRLCQVIH